MGEPTADELVYVYRDGQLAAPHPMTHDEAFVWLLRHQSQSVDWALRHGGWELVPLVRPQVVAEAFTEEGGRCAHCTRHVPAHASVSKLAPACCQVHYRRTSGDGGPGRWVCFACVDDLQPAPMPPKTASLFDDLEGDGHAGR